MFTSVLRSTGVECMWYARCSSTTDLAASGFIGFVALHAGACACICMYLVSTLYSVGLFRIGYVVGLNSRKVPTFLCFAHV